MNILRTAILFATMSVSGVASAQQTRLTALLQFLEINAMVSRQTQNVAAMRAELDRNPNNPDSQELGNFFATSTGGQTDGYYQLHPFMHDLVDQFENNVKRNVGGSLALAQAAQNSAGGNNGGGQEQRVGGNRFADFPATASVEQRRRALDPMVEVVAGRAPALNSNERAAAMSLLTSDADPIVRERLWQLLANSPRHEPAIALALQVLVDPEYVPRWSAFQYLRKVEPQIAGALAQRPPLAQTDARLLYVIADFVRPQDHQRWFALMLNALVAAGTDHEIFELVSLALARDGGETELADLRRRDQIAGGRTTYRLAAELLAAELARKPRSAK